MIDIDNEELIVVSRVNYDNKLKYYTIVSEHIYKDSKISSFIYLYKRIIESNFEEYYIIGTCLEGDNIVYELVDKNNLINYYLSRFEYDENNRIARNKDKEIILDKIGLNYINIKSIQHNIDNLNEFADKNAKDIDVMLQMINYLAEKYEFICDVPYIDIRETNKTMNTSKDFLYEFIEDTSIIEMSKFFKAGLMNEALYHRNLTIFYDKLINDNLRDSFTIYLGQIVTDRAKRTKGSILKVDYEIRRES